MPGIASRTASTRSVPSSTRCSRVDDMAGQVERFHPQAPKELDRYLIPTEQIIFMLRRHWIVLFEPIASVIAGLIVVVFLDQTLSGSGLKLRDIALVLWLGLLLAVLRRFLGRGKGFFV